MNVQWNDRRGSLELMQTLAPNPLPGPTITLALDGSKIFQMKTMSFFWIKPLQSVRPPEAMLMSMIILISQETMVMSVICAATGSQAEVLAWSVLPRRTTLRFASCAAAGGHVEVHDPGC